jgi:hypothetical protein
MAMFRLAVTAVPRLAVTLIALLATEAQAQVRGGIGQGVPQPPFVFLGPHAIIGGPTPTIPGAPSEAAGCGNSTVQGSDVAGAITFGSTSDPAQQCSIRFSQPWPAYPVYCLVQAFPAVGGDPPPAAFRFTPGTTFLYFTGFAVGGLAVWHCFGSGPTTP